MTIGQTFCIAVGFLFLVAKATDHTEECYTLLELVGHPVVLPLSTPTTSVYKDGKNAFFFLLGKRTHMAKHF